MPGNDKYMKDLTLRYYDAEIRYLREAAKEFAQAHPDRAAMLDLDKSGTPDPYVERLFEGFAFSMGRLREKIDDDLPEFTEGLVSMLWPHYLRTIPSLSIVALSTAIQSMKIAETVPASMEVYSRPIGPKNTVCQYRTTRATVLNPLEVSKVVMAAEPDGRSVLRLRLACSSQTDWTQVDLRRLSFYLAGDAPVSSALHLALTRRQAAFYLRFPDQVDRVKIDGWFSPGGFSEDDLLWPKGESAFSGYQLLLEYFTFRQKFMFVHLNGLENVTFPVGIAFFDIEVVLQSQWQSDLPVTDEALQLHCVPVINLFSLEADPLIINGLESEYLLRPRRLQDGHTEIYSVDSVTGSQRTAGAIYVPFTSFRHRGGMQRRHAPERYYHTRVKRGVTGLHDTWLILGGVQWEADRHLMREAVSLKITGTNGQLPRKALQSTILDRCESVLQTPLKVRNLCKPTLPAYPPAEDRFQWRVLSHLGSSYLNLMGNADVLRNTLELYNWQNDELNNRRLDAIQHVTHHQIQRFEKGFLLRGIDIEITLDSNGFTGEGDVHLFGEMLNRFFALYADIHLFNQLTLIVQPAGKCIRWKENYNQRLPG
jgi:type VI secretion system protein ImpG